MVEHRCVFFTQTNPVLRSIGQNPKEKELDKLFDKLDMNMNNKIDFIELIKLVESVIIDSSGPNDGTESAEILKFIFTLFDPTLFQKPDKHFDPQLDPPVIDPFDILNILENVKDVNYDAHSHAMKPFRLKNLPGIINPDHINPHDSETECIGLGPENCSKSSAKRSSSKKGHVKIIRKETSTFDSAITDALEKVENTPDLLFTSSSKNSTAIKNRHQTDTACHLMPETSSRRDSKSYSDSDLPQKNLAISSSSSQKNSLKLKSYNLIESINFDSFNANLQEKLHLLESKVLGDSSDQNLALKKLAGHFIKNEDQILFEQFKQEMLDLCSDDQGQKKLNFDDFCDWLQLS